jgi:hypothetical protein
MALTVFLGTGHCWPGGKICPKPRKFFVDAQVTLKGRFFPAIKADQNRSSFAVYVLLIGVPASIFGARPSWLRLSAGRHSEVGAFGIPAKIYLDILHSLWYTLVNTFLGQKKRPPSSIISEEEGLCY